MNRLSNHSIIRYIVLVLLAIALLQSWGAIVSFLSIVLTAIVPLVLGACIAYVVSIPTKFLERHILPHSTSKIVEGLRRPVGLAIAVILLLVGLGLASMVLVPAFVDAVSMVQREWQGFVEHLLTLPLFAPLEDAVHDFLGSDFMQSLYNLDIQGIMNTFFGGNMAAVSTQVFTVVSSIMTGFFGLLFSFILLTDTTDVWSRVMNIAMVYLGPKQTEHLALVIGVADASFHNFIVRQFIEALILGSVGGAVLMVVRFEFALGVGMIMGLSALVPIVGYPVGLCFGAFMVAIYEPWTALLFIVVVAIAQVLEATFLLPHVGDPRTVLPPVWTTIGVTIGGGVAGFIGMLIAIPLAATIRQLVIINARRRMAQNEEPPVSERSDSDQQLTVQAEAQAQPMPVHMRPNVPDISEEIK